MNTIAPLALFNMPGGMEWLVALLLALLLFGRRLPEVARSFGKSIVEFKKGIRDVRDDVESAGRFESTEKSPPKIEEKKQEAPKP